MSSSRKPAKPAYSNTPEEQLQNNFEDMFKRQEIVNARVSPQWVTKVKSGEWDYLFAGIEEMVELAKCIPFPDRTGYKWWSKAQDKQEAELNVVMELVDAWHFFISADIALDNVHHLANSYTQRYTDAVENIKHDSITPMELIKRIVAICSRGIGFPAYLFFLLCLKLGVNAQLLYSVYIAKSVLNVFRQDKGYREGKYIKIWRDGKEDNHHMMVWLIAKMKTRQMELSDVEIRAWLEGQYKDLTQPGE